MGWGFRLSGQGFLAVQVSAGQCRGFRFKLHAFRLRVSASGFWVLGGLRTQAGCRGCAFRVGSLDWRLGFGPQATP